MYSMIFMKRVLLIITTAAVYSCGSINTEVTNWKMYYDAEKIKIKEEGTLINGLEEGAWNYYSEKGDIIKQGVYEDGLQNGRWYYDIPGISKEIVWQKNETKKLNFSLPIDFTYKGELSDSYNYVYRDTQQHSLLKISILEKCDKKCVAEYYDLTLNALKGSSIVQTSSTLKVNSSSGDIFLDSYLLLKNENRDTLRQLMLYKSLNENQAVFLTIVDWDKDTEYIKLIITEVLYHIKYNFDRVIPISGERNVYELSK